MRRGRRQDRNNLVAAAEIAAFVYCPEQWRLQSGLGLVPANRAALDAGNRHHAGKAVAERIAGGAVVEVWQRFATLLPEPGRGRGGTGPLEQPLTPTQCMLQCMILAISRGAGVGGLPGGKTEELEWTLIG